MAVQERNEILFEKTRKEAEIVHIAEPLEALRHVRSLGYSPYAIEIAEDALLMGSFTFLHKVALVLGNESVGLSAEFLKACDGIVTVPHYGRVASLNVAVTASIAMYELMKGKAGVSSIAGDEYV